MPTTGKYSDDRKVRKPSQNPNHDKAIIEAVIRTYRQGRMAGHDNLYRRVANIVNNEQAPLLVRKLTKNSVSGMICRARKRGELKDIPPEMKQQHFQSRPRNGSPFYLY